MNPDDTDLRPVESTMYDSTSSAPIVRMGSSTVMNPTSSVIAGAEVRFVPFAHFRSGGQVYTRAVGYHSDGDAIILREEQEHDSNTDNPSASDTDGARKRVNLSTSHKIEQPLNQQKLEVKGLRAFPGVTGPKARHKHRRWRNQFFIDDKDDHADLKSHPAKMTKETFQELYTHRTRTEFQFHDSEGEIAAQWAPFVELTEEKQERLLRKASKPTHPPEAPAKEKGGTSAQRWARIGKPLRAELVRVAGARESFVAPVEARLSAYLEEIDRARTDCEEVTPLVLRFADSYHRLLCHGIVTYYCLDSSSKTGDDGERYTVIVPPKCPTFPYPRPENTLVGYIAAMAVQVCGVTMGFVGEERGVVV